MTGHMLAALALLMLAISPPRAGRAQAAQAVDLELVLAVDVSFSVDRREARLQRQGYVDAFRRRVVADAVTAGKHGRIAVTYLEWADPGRARVVVPWTVIDGPAGALGFAKALGDAPIGRGYYTALGDVLLDAARLIESNGYAGERLVIDVSGDGLSYQGTELTTARSVLEPMGVTVNGLVVLSGPGGEEAPGPPAQSGDTRAARRRDILLRFYREEVSMGPGSFTMTAVSYDSFRSAILAKLLKEISALPQEDQSNTP